MTSSSPVSSVSGRRLLVVMRHARAEAFAQEDQRRELTDRGRRDAVAAGRWLAATGRAPTDAWVSPAVRARRTWEAVAQGAGVTVEPVLDGALYAGGPEAVLEVLRTAPADASVLLYVGHNPTAASLAHSLDDGNADPEAFRQVSSGFPPAALAVLEVRRPWSELDVASARLVAFHVGHG